MQQEPRGRAVYGAVSHSRRLVPLARECLRYGLGRRSHGTRLAPIQLHRRPAPAGRGGPARRPVLSGQDRPAPRPPTPPRSRTWVRVSVAAATAPHRKAAANSASSTRCSQSSAMAPALHGSAAPRANRPSPASSGATHERGDLTSGGGVYLQWQGARRLRAAGTASSPTEPSGGPGARCGRSWAASARSGRPGWARTARGRPSGRGARGTASLLAVRR